jgi:chitinase
MTLKNGTGAVVKTVTTLADGTYSVAGVPAGVNYVLVPTKAGMTFTPASKSYTNLSANQVAQNFSGT